MKKLTKILSVVLCVMMIFSSANILSFAADETVSDTVITEESTETEDNENTDDKEQTAETQTEPSVPSENKKKKLTYAESVGGAFATGVYLLGAIVEAPLGASALCVAFLPAIVILPAILPVAAAGGVGAAALGVLIMALSPVIGLVSYIAQ